MLEYLFILNPTFDFSLSISREDLNFQHRKSKIYTNLISLFKKMKLAKIMLSQEVSWGVGNSPEYLRLPVGIKVMGIAFT